MANSFFQFKKFIVHQERSAMKVTTDGCLFGAWVADSIRNMNDTDQFALDIGTGTGLIALMLAQQTLCCIDAIEIDQDTFDQASGNISASPWSEKIHVVHADAKEYEFSKEYDFVISNPPFYEKELKGDDTKKNIAHHNEGLLLPELLSVIKKNLAENGRFFLLLPYKRNEEIKKLFAKHELFIEQIVFVRQTDQHDYFRIMLEGRLNQVAAETSISEIAIKQGDQYSVEFRELLKDYYLHL